MSKEEFFDDLQVDIDQNSVRDTLFVLEKASEEELVKIMSSYDESKQDNLFLAAYSSGKRELANKIAKAQKTANMNNVQHLKDAIHNGTAEEFLSQLSHNQKISMSRFMNVSMQTGELADEDQVVLDTLEKSIDDDALARDKKETEPTLDD